MQNGSNTLSVTIGGFLMGIIPYICKWMTIMPQRAYYILSSIFGVIAIVGVIIVKLIERKQKGDCSAVRQDDADIHHRLDRLQWPLYSLILSIMFFLCTIIFPVIHESGDEERIPFGYKIRQLDSLKVQAEKGDPHAMYLLGNIYAHMGLGEKDYVFVNYGEADKYFSMAVDSGSAEACVELAAMIDNGLGCKASRRRAIDELRAGFKSDPQNEILIKALIDLNISEKDFPEGASQMAAYKLKLAEDQRILYNEKVAFSDLTNKLYKEFERIGKPPIDSVAMLQFCSRAIPQLRDSRFSSWQSYELLSSMCLFTKDYDAGLKYAEHLKETDSNKKELYNLFFSAQQKYCEGQQKIDSVLQFSDDTIVEYLTSVDPDSIKVDPFFVVALRLENLKRMSKRAGEPLLTSDDYIFLLKEYRGLMDLYKTNTDSSIPSPPWNYGEMKIIIDYDRGDIISNCSLRRESTN